MNSRLGFSPMENFSLDFFRSFGYCIKYPVYGMISNCFIPVKEKKQKGEEETAYEKSVSFTSKCLWFGGHAADLR
jgi:hypothetical protein